MKEIYEWLLQLVINNHTSQINELNNRVDNIEGKVNTIERDVTQMKGEMHKVGAMSAALAGLRNLAFDPSSKLNFSVAGGFYREASAMALGASYQPNEDVLFAVGTSVGNNDNMYNVSATFKVGPSENVVLILTMNAWRQSAPFMYSTIK